MSADDLTQAVEVYPPLQAYLDTWARHCGAPLGVFTGQTIRMLFDCIRMATGGQTLPAMAPGVEEDMLLALRFGYYVRSVSLVPDHVYDALEKEFIDRPEIEDSPLMQPGSDKYGDYPARVRALYLYLALYRVEKAPKTARKPGSAARSRPVKPPASVRTAKPAPEAATGTLF